LREQRHVGISSSGFHFISLIYTSAMDTFLPPAEDDGSRTIWNINLPRRMIILPPTALALGLVIGMSRGGSRARLRFLAENAHRQPTTIQGWVSEERAQSQYNNGRSLT
jgi:hypothetical protein